MGDTFFETFEEKILLKAKMNDMNTFTQELSDQMEKIGGKRRRTVGWALVKRRL